VGCDSLTPTPLPEGIGAKLSECSCLEQHGGRYSALPPDGRIKEKNEDSRTFGQPLLHLSQTWGRRLRDKDLVIPYKLALMLPKGRGEAS